MRKLISSILIISLLSLIYTPYAFALTTDTAGEKSYSVELYDYHTVSGGEYSNSLMKLSEGASVVYNIYIPFVSAGVEFKYANLNESADVVFTMNGKEFNKEFTGISSTIEFSPYMIMGEYTITVKTNDSLNISSVVFKRANMLGDVIMGSDADRIAGYETLPNLTDYEKAIQTAIILSSASPVIMVNGGRRYVNNDDARELPYVEGNEIYLPIHTFSRAFEYYYEQKDNEWVITKDAHTFHYKNSRLTRQDYSETPYEIENITRVVNKKVYFPLGYFAELEGKVLVKRDNIYVVEYPSNARTIIKDKIFNELSRNYADWVLMEKTGNTYYVSKECKSCDDNDGTERKPFKTIKKAAEVAKAGDTVIIKGGTYYETLAPQNDGTVSNPIVFKAAEGETVTLSATANLGAPIGTKTNVYGQEMLVYNALTDLGYGRNQIFYDKENLLAGIHPNDNTNENMNYRPKNLHSLWGVQGNIRVSENNSSVLTSTSDLIQQDDFWKGATVIAYTGNAWSLGAAKVDKSTSGKLTVTDKCKQWWFASKGHKTDYAWITNHINTVDKPGEWAYEDGRIYILPPEGETAESLQLEQKVRQVLVDLSGNKYVRVEGINTYGGGIKMNESEMCMLRDGEYKYISHYTYSKDQRDGYIDDWNVYDTNGAPPRGEMGIYLGGRDNVIINNTIQYSAAAGIYSVGLYEYIENNAILDCGYMASYVGGLFIGTEAWKEPETPRGGNAIYANTLHRAGRHAYGYSTTEAWYGAGSIKNEEDRKIPAFLPSEFAYNDIKDGSIHARDTAPWYQYGLIAGTERLKTRDHHNVVANSWANDGTMNSLVYYDGQTAMFQFYNNVMYWTNDDVQYHLSLYRQETSGSQTVTDEWNNSDLGYIEGGKNSIKSEQYPNGKIFASGASWLLADKTPYINNNQSDFINLSNTEISSGAKIENGLFKPSGDGDWICFKDVDFSGNKNKLSIYYTGNYCNTQDEISVIIGESIDEYLIKKDLKIYDYSPQSEAVDVCDVRFYGDMTKTNLYIKVNKYHSINIEKIRLSFEDDEMSGVVTGYYADESKVVDWSGAGFTVIPEGETHKIINQTSGTVLKYSNVTIPIECNKLFVRACSKGAAHMGQKIELRVGSNSSNNTYAIYETGKNSWYDYTMESVIMDKPLPAGTYDIYIKFESGKYSNFLWFGLGTDN